MKKIHTLKKYGLLVMAVFLLGISNAHENYVAGYILTTHHDTIRGYVDFKNWEKNPGKINFKRTLESDPKTYRPLEIAEFGVYNEIYKSAIVESEYSPLAISELDFDSKQKLNVDTTFLQTLLRGDKGLYYYKNDAGRENFYIPSGNGYELLLYKKYLKWADNKKVVVENKKYIGQLMIYLEDCPSIATKIRSVQYKPKSLIKLFSHYYDCTTKEISFQRNEEKPKLSFGILAGVSNTSIKFNKTAFEYLGNTDYGRSTEFSAGVTLALDLPRSLDKWSIQSELLYSQFKLNGSYEDFVNEDYYTITNTYLEFSYLNLNLLARYRHPLGRFHLCFTGGLSNGFVLDEENHKIEEVKFYTDQRVTYDHALNGIRKYEIAYLIGAGMLYDKFSIEIRFENGNGVSGTNTPSSSTTSFFALLGYKF